MRLHAISNFAKSHNGIFTFLRKNLTPIPYFLKIEGDRLEVYLMSYKFLSTNFLDLIRSLNAEYKPSILEEGIQISENLCTEAQL
jgi:hypothetical protein